MTNNKKTPDDLPLKKQTVMASSTSAGQTNKIHGSIVLCEVNLELGQWISPDPCSEFYIDEEAVFPSIRFEISTDHPGPYDWSWQITWSALACPQKPNRKRFAPKNGCRVFLEKGSFTAESKIWKADLGGRSLGGELTVTVKAGSTRFVRKAFIRAKEPGNARINKELDILEAKYQKETYFARKIFKQETEFKHFYSDECPRVSFDNGYGMGQATQPIPSYNQAWDWKEHVNYVVTKVIKKKLSAARKYLDQHGNYNDEHLEAETLVHYNGANHHYFIWDEKMKKWIENPLVLCDPTQSNSGWDMKNEKNQAKTLEELQKGEGTTPIYTGRCYAKHIKDHQ